MPGAIGWAPALLPSRGGVIAHPTFNPGTPILRAAIGTSRSRGSRFATPRPNSALRQARSLCEVQIFRRYNFLAIRGGQHRLKGLRDFGFTGHEFLRLPIAPP